VEILITEMMIKIFYPTLSKHMLGKWGSGDSQIFFQIKSITSTSTSYHGYTATSANLKTLKEEGCQ
jgi:hypothetical protein